jgi:hypothetical protein
MTRLTIRRGGTKRLRATYFTDQPAGIVRNLSGLSLIIIDHEHRRVTKVLPIFLK